MRTETTVEIIPPQDTVHIACGQNGLAYEIRVRRDTYQSTLTLQFPDFESMANMVDDLTADLDNLRSMRGA